MRYLLLSVLVVSLVGVLVIPNAYSDIQYNIKEGTTVQYKVDSTCETSITEWGSKILDLESELKKNTCNHVLPFYYSEDRHFWETVSTISVRVTDVSILESFPSGSYGYNFEVGITMKNGTSQEKSVFLNIEKNSAWQYVIPSNLEVGDIIGEFPIKNGNKFTAKITDRKIMTVGGTPYVILIASAGCDVKLVDGDTVDADVCWKYFYEQESGMVVGKEDTITISLDNPDGTETSTASASTTIMFTNISTAKTITEPESTQSNGGCGAGTVLVNGVCELVPTPEAKSSFMSIEPIYLIIGVVAIGGIIGAIAVAKRGSKTPKPAKQELDEYEEQYLAKPKRKPKPTKQKHVEKEETSSSCDNCGNSLKKTAKFCGKCGTPRA